MWQILYILPVRLTPSDLGDSVYSLLLPVPIFIGLAFITQKVIDWERKVCISILTHTNRTSSGPGCFGDPLTQTGLSFSTVEQFLQQISVPHEVQPLGYRRKISRRDKYINLFSQSHPEVRPFLWDMGA